MKKNLLFFWLTICCQLALVAQTTKYAYHTDLTKVVDDKVKVTLLTPTVSTSKTTFVIPSIVAGTYAKKDYGRFVSDLKAFDDKGRSIKVKRKSDNLFEICKAKRLHKIEYWVEDTWDTGNTQNWVFEPSGTNIDADKNFVINHHAFYGYLEGYKNLPFELTYTKPSNLFGASALKSQKISATEDLFSAPNYVFLVDNPIMYAEPDTAVFKVNNMTVTIASYSPNKVVKAQQLRSYLEPVARALGNFFGTLPVDNYHFLFYFADPSAERPEIESGLSGFGALEHSYCSMYYLPEIELVDYLRQLVNDVAAHEFMHILTPLNIHSKEIEDFNFITPNMSQHLWMYEGMTEYFAHIVQLRGGVTQEADFIKEMRQKIEATEKFDNFSFTEMSRRVVEPKFQDYYLDVYQEGALIGWCLDALLLKESKGKMGVRELMLQLSQRYGPNKPFEDGKLFDEIVSMTYPSVRQFFDRYVIGKQNIPYEDYAKYLGYEYIPQEWISAYTYGQFGIGFDPDQQALFFTTVPPDNTLKAEAGDILVAINGEKLDPAQPMLIQDMLINNIYKKADDSPITLTVMRKDKKIDLTGSPTKTQMAQKHVLRPIESPTPEQQQLREIFLKGVR